MTNISDNQFDNELLLVLFNQDFLGLMDLYNWHKKTRQ